MKGAETMEFLIVLLIMVLMLFIIIAFGVGLYNQAVITNAAREGARAGIVLSKPKMDDDAIGRVVLDYCEQYLITFGGAVTPTVEVDRTGGSGTSRFGDPLQVSVGYRYAPPSFVNWNPTLQAVAVMLHE
jgi:Flp pilus assembly protein TadG